MLPPTTRVGEVALTVPSLDRALAFYERVLALRVHARAPHEATLGAGAPFLRLVEDAHAPRRDPRAPGLFHHAILVPTRADLARVLRHLIETRWPLQGASDHHVSEAVYLADADGNGVEIYADRPRDVWSNAGRVDMRTLPLDVDGLLALDDGAAWRAPSDTTMGHVHLQVADARAAEAFYHDEVGLDVTARYGAEASFLSAGGYHHHLAVNTWNSAGARPPADGALGLRSFTLVAPGVEESARRDPSGNLVKIVSE